MRGRHDWEAEIRRQLLESAQVQRRLADSCVGAILKAATAIAESLRLGGKLLACGNGGSAADAQHLAAELVGRLRPGSQRRALAAIALTADTAALTALGNDYGFEAIFQRQVEALGCPGDILLAISTSGRSANLLRAAAAAASRRIITIGLSGGDGGLLAEAVDIAIVVPSEDGQRIQEGHAAIGHVICTIVEAIVCDEIKEAAWAVSGSSG